MENKPKSPAEQPQDNAVEQGEERSVFADQAEKVIDKYYSGAAELSSEDRADMSAAITADLEKIAKENAGDQEAMNAGFANYIQGLRKGDKEDTPANTNEADAKNDEASPEDDPAVEKKPGALKRLGLMYKNAFKNVFHKGPKRKDFEDSDLGEAEYINAKIESRQKRLGGASLIGVSVLAAYGAYRGVSEIADGAGTWLEGMDFGGDNNAEVTDPDAGNGDESMRVEEGSWDGSPDGELTPEEIEQRWEEASEYLANNGREGNDFNKFDIEFNEKTGEIANLDEFYDLLDEQYGKVPETLTSQLEQFQQYGVELPEEFSELAQLPGESAEDYQERIADILYENPQMHEDVKEFAMDYIRENGEVKELHDYKADYIFEDENGNIIVREDNHVANKHGDFVLSLYDADNDAGIRINCAQAAENLPVTEVAQPANPVGGKTEVEGTGGGKVEVEGTGGKTEAEGTGGGKTEVEKSDSEGGKTESEKTDAEGGKTEEEKSNDEKTDAEGGKEDDEKSSDEKTGEEKTDDENADKIPEADFNANPDLPAQLQMGDDRMEAGELQTEDQVTVPDEVYVSPTYDEAPAAPAPEATPVAPEVRQEEVIQAPAPEAPANTVVVPEVNEGLIDSGAGGFDTNDAGQAEGNVGRVEG